MNKLSNAKNRNVLPSKLRPVKTFKVGKKNFSGEHLKDDKQLALPPLRPKHGLRFLNSTNTSTVKSQCTTEQSGPQGLIMDTKYEKKAMIGPNKL